MSKAKELFELHKKILDSTRILPESEGLYSKYTKLSEIEQEELTSYILEEYDLLVHNEEVMTMLYHIAIFSEGNSLVKIYPTLIQHKLFYPAEVYIKAKEAEAKLLIEALENTSPNNLLQINSILMCLAYIPCDIVKDFLINASNVNVSKWSEHLHIKPIQYTLGGGWTIDKSNQVKQLYSDKVTVFRKNKNNVDCLKAPLTNSKETCPYCENNLTVIYNDEYELSTCLFCTCYQSITTKLDDNGRAHWHDKNEKSDLLNTILQKGTEISSFDYVLEQSDEKRLPAYTISQFVTITRSQIGGMPTWINDPEYPVCPDCGKIMTFVAQLDMEDVDEYGDGIYYFFYCNDCKVVSSGYGQS